MSTTLVEAQRRDRDRDGDGDGDGERWKFAVLILAAAMSSLVAFLLTDAACGGIELGGSIIGRSSYCTALNAPRGPHTLLSVALTIAIFGLPTLLAVGGAIGSVRAGRSCLLRLVTACCAVDVGLSFILITLAHSASLPTD